MTQSPQHLRFYRAQMLAAKRFAKINALIETGEADIIFKEFGCPETFDDKQVPLEHSECYIYVAIIFHTALMEQLNYLHETALALPRDSDNA